MAKLIREDGSTEVVEGSSFTQDDIRALLDAQTVRGIGTARLITLGPATEMVRPQTLFIDQGLHAEIKAARQAAFDEDEWTDFAALGLRRNEIAEWLVTPHGANAPHAYLYGTVFVCETRQYQRE
jgi:hypothetical protein